MRPSSSAEFLKKNHIPAALITDLVDIRYLTGLALSSGILLAVPKAFILFVDSRYSEEAKANVRRGVRIQSALNLQKFLEKVRTVAFESEEVTIARYSRWKRQFKNTKFVHYSGLLTEFRRSKDPEELQAVRRADRITRELLRRVPSALRTSVTEKSLAWKLRVWAQELGAEGLSFDPIVAFGTHTSRPHHHPTSRSLKKGNIVQIDVGAVFRGYCSDRSAVYFTAKPTPLQARVLTALMEARDSAEALIEPGCSTHALDKAARSVLKKYDLEEFFTHALGHGVGLEVHEGVTISGRAPDRKLLHAEVITIEPGVYLPGRFGMRLEDLIIVQ